MHARQQVHQGRLAGAIGPGQCVDLAAIRGEVHRFECRDGAEALAQAADLEQRRRRARARLARLHHFGLNCSGSLLAHQSSGLLISANFAASLGAM